MHNENVHDIQKDIIAIGRLLWEKDLAAGISGNLSKRIDAASFFITATQTCLGLLREKDIVCVSEEGHSVQEVEPSSEWRLHQAIYQAFPDCGAVAHVQDERGLVEADVTRLGLGKGHREPFHGGWSPPRVDRGP